MNATIFRRILWKEYRAQRAFWISIALATVIVESALLANPWASQPERIQSLFAAGLTFAVLYALGSAATLFATEREDETYDFLRALPVRPLVVFLGKIAYAVGSTAAMYLVAWSLALALARGLPDPNFNQRMWALLGVWGVELLAWGILFSLLLKRPLVAAILAGTVGSIDGIRFIGMDHITNGIPGRLLIVALVMAADIALAARWFRERWLRSARPPSKGFSEEQIEAIYDLVLPVRSTWASGVTRGTRDRPPSAATMLGRLLWQELRQSTAIKVALFVWLLPAAFLVWMSWILGNDYTRKPGLWPEVIIVPGFSAVLSSSLLYLGDQTGCRFRFLAEHGISPRLVWLSRQIGGFIVVLLGLLLVLPPTIGQIGHLPTGRWLVIESLLGAVVAAYACGQLCSMTFRSGLLAVISGTILTYVVCVWAVMMYMLGLSWLWSVAPLPLAFLVSTWLHAPDWLLERKTWRARLRSDLVIAAALLAILVAIPLVRVYEIPLVGPGFDPQGLTWPMPPEEKETRALYVRAIEFQQRANHTENTSARSEAEAQAVALAVQASRRPLPGYCLDPLVALDPNAEIDLAGLVLASGKPLQAAGRLDAALDRYVAAEHIALHARQRAPWLDGVLELNVCEQLTPWAAESGQKSERVLKALRTFENQWRSTPTYCEDIQRIYLLNLRMLKGDRGALKELPHSTEMTSYFAVTWMPWERARALRLLNKLTAEDFARCRDTEAALAAGGFAPPPSKIEITPALSRDFTYNLVSVNMPRVQFDDWLRVETYRRATRLVLALETWKLDHGGLPQSLNELRGKYFDQVPVDPRTGDAFQYEPKGLPYCAGVGAGGREND